MKGNRGFFLLEFLTALLLISLAVTGLTTGFIQILKCQRRIESSFRQEDEFRLLSLRLEKDARNAAAVSGHPFHGKKEEISFLAVEKEEGLPKVVELRYFLKGDLLIRSRRELGPELEKKSAIERVVVTDVRNVEFKFPYLGKEDEITYESSWPEEPYYGIPRALSLELVKDAGQPFSKVISIPQGRWAHLQ